MMAIQTVGSLNEILSNYNAKDWAKSADINEMSDFKMSELSLDNLEAKNTTGSFSDMLTNSIAEVNGLQKEADKAIQKLVTGKSKNLHETMLAVEKADIAFRTMNQVRTKVIDAYKEIMRMQV
jgi:flagellar hook-basal body complex protein FliE